jgi:hypothetical protein
MPKPKWKPTGGTWISVLIPNVMRADLDAIAAREARTLSNVVRIALGKFINQDHARRKLKG